MVCNFYCKQTTAERTADDRLGHCRAVLLSRFNYKITSAGEVALMRMRYPKRAPKRSSAPPIKLERTRHPKAVTHLVSVTAFLCGEGAKKREPYDNQIFQIFYEKSQYLNSNTSRR